MLIQKIDIEHKNSPKKPSDNSNKNAKIGEHFTEFVDLKQLSMRITDIETETQTKLENMQREITNHKHEVKSNDEVIDRTLNDIKNKSSELSLFQYSMKR